MDTEPRRARNEGLRHAHLELLELIDAMAPRLIVGELQRDASAARAMLSMLAGKLTIHLAMEDQALYPRLATHASLDVRQLAERFEKEMGGILDVFKQYLARWPNAEAIQSNSAAFVVETNQILDALRARIAKEDAEIFSRLDGT